MNLNIFYRNHAGLLFKHLERHSSFRLGITLCPFVSKLHSKHIGHTNQTGKFYKLFMSSFKDNPKLFWSYHKAILHHHGKSTSKITHNGKKATSPAGKAELFNSYFSSVFRPPSSQQDIDNIDNTNLLDCGIMNNKRLAFNLT